MWFNLLLIFVPVAFFLKFTDASGTLVFIASALAILPLAGIMGRATEELAVKAGSTVGGLLNATFGNATELIIAFFALKAGKIEVVTASIIGSILGNLLLVLGLAVLLGGLKHKVQKFNVQSAGTVASLLTISVVALLVPAVFDISARAVTGVRAAVALDVRFSDAAAVVLIVLYVAYIVFTLITHKDLLSNTEEHEETAKWSVPLALGVLVGSTVVVGFMSEFLVGGLDEASASLGLSELFVGLIVIPIIGNAAEHSSAVLMAMKNRMDLAVSIAVGSSAQVALLIAPILVFVGLALGQPMDLAFNVFEVAAVALAVAVATSVVRDAESHWLEGAFLLLVYGMLAVAFFFF